ncbi:MAG: TIGR00341 family protein [Chloroflexi bacterium]|nr:TIGR00341 family protein [Chloroflexota bacterium]
MNSSPTPENALPVDEPDLASKEHGHKALRQPDHYYGLRVLVPIANPATAAHLIDFAASLVHPEKGKIKALFVVLPDSPYEDAKEKLEHITRRAKERGLPIEFISVTAINVSRGVLDATKEENADLLVLGYQTPREGKVVLGPVTEAIARAVTVDLVVYRHIENAEIKRITVPITNLPGTRTAVIHAMHLATAYQVPVRALFVRTGQPTTFQEDHTEPFWLRQARIYDMLYEVAENPRLEVDVARADDFVSGIEASCDETELIVYSVEQNHNGLERYLFGVTSQKLLRLAPGSIAMVRRAVYQATPWQRLTGYLSRWTPRLTMGERTEVIQQASDLTRTTINFIVMIVLSAILATVGLWQSSGAVIIGAMLVAPLMSPLMGFGVGWAIGDLGLMRRSGQTVFTGVLLVVLTAAIIGLVFPLPTPTNEMLARSRPNLLDMLVALASGAAGAFALARRDIPAALAGVAIAAALVPPICTTGLAAAMGDYELMLGAGSLSLVNIIGISLTAAGIFSVMGVHQHGSIPFRQRAIISTTVLLVTAIPLGFILLGDYLYVNANYAVEQVIEDELPDARVVNIDIAGRRNLNIQVTIQTPNTVTRRQITTVEEELEDRLERDVSLDVVILRVVRAVDDEETSQD